MGDLFVPLTKAITKKAVVWRGQKFEIWRQISKSGWNQNDSLRPQELQGRLTAAVPRTENVPTTQIINFFMRAWWGTNEWWADVSI